MAVTGLFILQFSPFLLMHFEALLRDTYIFSLLYRLDKLTLLLFSNLPLVSFHFSLDSLASVAGQGC